jgi:pyruvate dehydrogenase E2 component (dihydrolipoamide acetyltransferase)
MANIVEMPKLGFDMAEGKLARWVIGENKEVEKGGVLAEIETDKATVEVESSFSGVVIKHIAQEGESLPIGSPIAVIADMGEKVDLDKLLKNYSSIEQTGKPKNAPPAVDSSLEKEVKTTKAELEDKFIKASPVAKHIAEEKGIDITQIRGSGPDGRIVKRDVEAAITVAATQTTKEFHKDSVVHGQDSVIEVSKLRAAIGNRLTESHQSIPHFYITSMYDVAEMLKTRKQLNKDLSDDARVSVNDFIIRAVALTLRDFPNLNASIKGTKLTRHGDINIGVAVAVENGLLTVVIKNADQKPLNQISAEVKDMVERVQAGKVRTEDIEGSTFTISNLGMYNVEDFVAIINPPEAAILAIGSAKEMPIVKDGALEIGMRMKATISADHRITDGAEAAKFMQHLSLFIEQPWRLFA